MDSASRSGVPLEETLQPGQASAAGDATQSGRGLLMSKFADAMQDDEAQEPMQDTGLPVLELRGCLSKDRVSGEPWGTASGHHSGPPPSTGLCAGSHEDFKAP